MTEPISILRPTKDLKQLLLVLLARVSGIADRDDHGLV
jgi:hypothetical protein